MMSLSSTILSVVVSEFERQFDRSTEDAYGSMDFVLARVSIMVLYLLLAKIMALQSWSMMGKEYNLVVVGRTDK